MEFSRAAVAFPAELNDLRDWASVSSAGFYRVALLIPMCGSAGLWAPSCISSAQLAVEEINRGNGINGRQVQLIMIDSALEAKVPVEEIVNDLIEANAIDAIVGMHISAIRQRLSKVVRQRVPYVYTPLYEGGENTPGIFAIGETPHEQLGPAIETLQQQFRPKRWALIGNDYVWPHTSHSYAKTKLKELSVGLCYERYLPFGVRNMSHYVDEIAHSGAEALLISLVGQDAVTFNRAFGAAGLDGKMIRLSCCIEENGLLACGDRNLKRFFSSASYFGSLRTEGNCAFKESYYGLHGDKAPVLNVIGQSTYEGVHYLAALMDDKSGDWRERNTLSGSAFRYRSVKRAFSPKRPVARAPIYLARADGIMFEVIKQI